MIALQITSMKNFMTQLLAADTFDIFLLEEAVITVGNTISIDGHFNSAFYTAPTVAGAELTAEDASLCPYEFTPWKQVKGMCFNLIKGKHTPLSFKFVFQLNPEQMKRLLVKEECSVDPSLIKALVLTIRFDGTKTLLTTGTSYTTFVLSKEPDQIWDKVLQKYLAGKGISFEAVS